MASAYRSRTRNRRLGARRRFSFPVHGARMESVDVEGLRLPQALCHGAARKFRGAAPMDCPH